nr:hypothetical protein Q903MT_gene4950 [Picea sitchensis]
MRGARIRAAPPTIERGRILIWSAQTCCLPPTRCCLIWVDKRIPKMKVPFRCGNLLALYMILSQAIYPL